MKWKLRIMKMELEKQNYGKSIMRLTAGDSSVQSWGGDSIAVINCDGGVMNQLVSLVGSAYAFLREMVTCRWRW
jgi:hypothetical protein